MSDDAWNRFKPSNSNKGPKKPVKIGWKSDAAPKKTPKVESKTPDLFSIWDDQKRMELEEKKMARELAETKKKAKELQKTLRKHQFGETKIKLEGKSKAAADKGRGLLSQVKAWAGAHKKLAVGSAIAFVGLVVLVNIFGPNSNSGSDQTDTLGDSTEFTSETLPREKPSFTILYPSGSNEDNLETVKISPEGAAAAYTFVDSFEDGQDLFQVTQQLVPDNFDIEKTSKDFQASSIIQIDETKVFHGYSEKAGIQSLLFVKDDKLVSIRSPKKFEDQQWAGYILSLQ